MTKCAYAKIGTCCRCKVCAAAGWIANNFDREDVAGDAYALAGAMLAARKQGGAA